MRRVDRSSETRTAPAADALRSSASTQAEGVPRTGSRPAPQTLDGAPAPPPPVERASRLGHRLARTFHIQGGPSGAIQRVHPAFNSFNFWRDDLPDGSPHPMSPEGQKIRLRGLYGNAVGDALLYTEAKDDDAIPREKIVERFWAALPKGPIRETLALRGMTVEPKNNEALELQLAAGVKAVKNQFANKGDGPGTMAILDNVLTATTGQDIVAFATMVERYDSPPDELATQAPRRGPKKGTVLRDTQRHLVGLKDPPRQDLPPEFIRDLRRGEVVSVIDELPAEDNGPGHKAPAQVQVKPRLQPGDPNAGNLWFVLKADVQVGADPILLDYKAVPVFPQAGGPVPGHIAQQRLGDCYFLAAIGSIVAKDPGVITSMISSPDSDTPAVRFFRKKSVPPKVAFVPEWIQVDKTMFADPGTRKSLYAKAEDILWPALLEKAYALFEGKGLGFQPIDEGGHADAVYEAVLGDQARRETIFEHPLELTVDDPDLTRLVPNRPDRKKFTEYVTAQGLGASIAFKADPIKVKQAIVDSGISVEAQTALKKHVDRHLAPALGAKGKYSVRDEEIYGRADMALATKRPVSLSTKAWGQGGTGQSGGENTEEVAGLASTHAYMVLGAKETEEGRKYLRLRNPWGTFGRGYKKDSFLSSVSKGTATVAPELGTEKTAVPKEIAEGEFWLELSDINRYFQSIYFA